MQPPRGRAPRFSAEKRNGELPQQGPTPSGAIMLKSHVIPSSLSQAQTNTSFSSAHVDAPNLPASITGAGLRIRILSISVPSGFGRRRSADPKMPGKERQLTS